MDNVKSKNPQFCGKRAVTNRHPPSPLRGYGRAGGNGTSTGGAAAVGGCEAKSAATPQIGYNFVQQAPPLRFVGVLSRRERSILAESSLVVHCL